jgi:hypothetical protein
MAEDERSERFANSYGSFIAGAGAITAGLVADLVYDRSYGPILWVIGAGAEINGLINLFMKDPFERMALQTRSFSASELQSEWAQRALTSRKTRQIGGVVGLGAYSG